MDVLVLPVLIEKILGDVLIAANRRNEDVLARAFDLPVDLIERVLAVQCQECEWGRITDPWDRPKCHRNGFHDVRNCVCKTN
jgi:hypothetical protein